MSATKRTKPASNERHSTGQKPARAKHASQSVPTEAISAAITSKASGKIGKIIALLRRPKGVTIVDLSKATEWQAHSIRGAISGTIRKKHGLPVISEKRGDVRIYRIAE